jgi:hypothetical protein
LRADVERVLRLIGCASVAELNPSLVDVPEVWRAKPLTHRHRDDQSPHTPIP